MSDLTGASVLAKTRTALPVDWHVDPKLHEMEMKLLFENGPGYVGHERMVPAQGDYHVLDWHVLDWLHGGGKMLVRNEQGINPAGPYQSPTEGGMVHFRAWCRRIVEPHL